MRRTVKSSTSIVAVVAGSLHSNKKPLSTELRRYQGFGVDVALLQLGFDATDFDSLPLVTNDLMEWANRNAMRAVQASQTLAFHPLDCGDRCPQDTPAECAHPRTHAPSPVLEVQNVSIRG